MTEQVTIYASGQRFIPAVPGEHDDIRENFIYSIDLETGVATAISPETTGLPSALAGTTEKDLLGFKSGQLVELNPTTAQTTTIATFTGLNATGFDILEDGQAFIIPFNSENETQQLYRLDVDTQTGIPLGSVTAVGDAIDTARGTPLGTAEPFIISLGSVDGTIYGVDLDSESLISLNPDTGNAAVVGNVGAVTSGELSDYSGFAGLTGVDTDNDGDFDSLVGNVNFEDGERLGGIARYNLTNGTWELIASNEGVIFFGMGSFPGVISEPDLLPDNVFGTSDADVFDSELPDEKQFRGESQNLFTGSGNDTVDVVLAIGNNRIDLGSDLDTIFAGSNNRILAGSGDDIMFLGSGDGNNVVSGGLGRDQFWIVTDIGALPTNPNLITDFTPGEDVIGLANTSFNFNDLTLNQDSNNVVISALGQDLAILLNTQVNSLNESHFFFA